MSSALAVPQEHWRACPGAESHYSVSSIGRVRRDVGGNGTFAGRILSPKRHHTGYRVVVLSCDGLKQERLVHRLVCEAFYGPPPTDFKVNHRDADRGNNRVENLEWMSAADNARDGIRRHNPLGRFKALQHPSAKITPGMAAEMLRLAPSMTIRAIAARFGVADSQICLVLNRRHWTTRAPTPDPAPAGSDGSPS